MLSSPTTYVAESCLRPSAACTPRAVATQQPATSEPNGPVAPALPISRIEAQSPHHVVSQRANAWFFHDVARISRFFSANKYTCFVQDGVEHIATESLSSLEQRLAAFGFMRAHRAELINLRHVKVVRRVRHSFEVTLIDGQTVQASRRLVRALRDKLAF